MLNFHKGAQRGLQDPDPETRRSAYEALIAIDNRAFALLALSSGFFASLIWFDMVDQESYREK